eukprot:symbB.v1.2.022881.t1/scaffold2049.1/size91137/8
MELLDEEEAMRSYLQRCERDRSHFWYSRHLQMVELHVHLLHPKLWDSLEDEVRFFLQEMRKNAQGSAAEHDDGSDDDDSGEAAAPVLRRFDRKRFNSELHEDLSRILSSMGLGHQNKVSAGPLVLDIHLQDMCIVEALAAWSFYLRSSHLTALARRRQEMLKAMGFDMAVVPYFRWEQLQDDDAKRKFLWETLPAQVFRQPGSAATSEAAAVYRRPVSMESRVHRFKALQDLLAALVPNTGTVVQQEGIPISRVSETALAGLSVLVPDSVVQQALHIVDSKGISCVTCEGSWRRSIYEVKGQKSSHLVLAHGLYCSCRDAYLFAIFGEVANVSLLGKGLLAQRAIQRGPPTAPRRPRRGRPVPKPVQERTPRLPPLSDDVWKPEPVAEEEVLLATKVDGQSLKDVAAEVWRGGRVLFTKRWSDLLKVRKALNVIAKERVQVSAGMDDSAVLRERRPRGQRQGLKRLIRDAARRLFVRVQRNGELCVEGGPVLGYVPVMYPHHDGPPLAFRANDVTALNVAWQFFVNGLDYSFLPHTLHPFFGVYFTLSPTEHFQLLRDWLKTYKPSSDCRALDLGTGSGVISFLLRHHFDATMSIVASDRCPNAVFSVQAELERHGGPQNITVKRGDLFDGLKEEAFDLIIFNPPWVPQPPGRTELPGDVVMGNDYPPELFQRLFSDVPEVLKPNGRLLVLFSNYAQCRGLVKRSPMEDGARMLQLEEVQRRPYFARRVVEGGELCCKHWLAVQVARQCGMGIATTTSKQEDEFVEWGQKHLLAGASGVTGTGEAA